MSCGTKKALGRDTNFVPISRRLQPRQFAFSTALPNAAYATTLIGSASNVADALLGPTTRWRGSKTARLYGLQVQILNLAKICARLRVG